MKRTYKYGETLTEDEQMFICKKFLCPDCRVGKFLEGPFGGAAQNFYCGTCQSKFNFLMPFGIDRISESSRNQSEDEKAAGNKVEELPAARLHEELPRDGELIISWGEGISNSMKKALPIFLKALFVACLGALAIWLAGCKTDEERAMEKAVKVFGDAPVQCDKVDDGVACENLCTHEVLLCPSDKGTHCHFVNYIKLANTPAVSCPKAEKRGQRKEQK